MNTIQPTCKGGKGFTLVELAIVMIIIGLLIGGVLKGQELITNAQVVSTANQIKGFDAAITTFRDSQNGLPGDLTNPTVRLPNCLNAPCSFVSTAAGNGIINGGIPGQRNPATGNNESAPAWAQLNAANLISGIQQDATVEGFGVLTPAASIGGGYFLNYSTGTGAVLTGPAGSLSTGHYLTLAGSATANVTAANGLLSTAKAARIDRKLDDGVPNAGNVRGAGNAGCASDTTVTASWVESNEIIRCAIYTKIQN